MNPFIRTHLPLQEKSKQQNTITLLKKILAGPKTSDHHLRIQDQHSYIVPLVFDAFAFINEE